MVPVTNMRYGKATVLYMEYSHFGITKVSKSSTVTGKDNYHNIIIIAVVDAVVDLGENAQRF